MRVLRCVQYSTVQEGRSCRSSRVDEPGAWIWAAPDLGRGPQAARGHYYKRALLLGVVDWWSRRAGLGDGGQLGVRRQRLAGQGRAANRKRHWGAGGVGGERWRGLTADADGEVSRAHWPVGLRQHVPVPIRSPGLAARSAAAAAAAGCGRCRSLVCLVLHCTATATSARGGRCTDRYKDASTRAARTSTAGQVGRVPPLARVRCGVLLLVIINQLARMGIGKPGGAGAGADGGGGTATADGSALYLHKHHRGETKGTSCC